MAHKRKNQRRNSGNSKSRPHLDSTFRTKKVPIRVAHHKHTGRKLPFYCTSYAALFFILVFAFSLLLFVSSSVKADQQSGSVLLEGFVKGPPPDQAANITSPIDGSASLTRRIEIKGTCQPKTYIEIYRKGSFAGMTACSDNGDFVITITLVPGKNTLVAKTRDAVGQYGPDSAVITIFYNAPEQNPSTPLMIYTDPVQKGTLQYNSFTLDYDVNGGKPAYTVAIDWGDGSPTSLHKHENEGKFQSKHIYEQSGQMTLRISVIDSDAVQASIQTVVVVHPQTAPASGSITRSGECPGGNTFSSICTSSNPALLKIFDLAWPAVIVASLMTISFWVGEKVMIRELKFRR